jgi:hypothetical protein
MIYQILAKVFLICSIAFVIAAKAGSSHCSCPCEIAPMRDANTCDVYILAGGRHGTLYIGVTNNRPARLEQHRSGRGTIGKSGWPKSIIPIGVTGPTCSDQRWLWVRTFARTMPTDG